MSAAGVTSGGVFLRLTTMKISILSILLLCVALPASRLEAQGQDQFALGIAGGVTIPSGPASDYHTNGINGTLMWGIGGVDSPFGVRFDGMYSSLGRKKNSAGVSTQGSARLTSISANLLFKLAGSDMRLYTVGGVGGFTYNPDGAGTKANNDFGVNAGLGLWIPQVSGFVEARWYNFYRALPNEANTASGKRSLRIYPITVGIMY